MLVERFGPALGDLILDLIFNQHLVRSLRQSLLHRLFMQLVELIIESCDHVLNLCTLLLCFELLNDSSFDVARGVVLVGIAELSLDHLVLQNFVDGGILVILEQL